MSQSLGRALQILTSLGEGERSLDQLATELGVPLHVVPDELPRIAHMQLADVPGRHEPGTGEMDYPSLLSLIDRVGYTGWIGCEYIPTAKTVEGLAWAKPYLAG